MRKPVRVSLEDYKTILLALHFAAEWESSVMDSYDHMRSDPAYADAQKLRDQFLELGDRLRGPKRLPGKVVF